MDRWLWRERHWEKIRHTLAYYVECHQVHFDQVYVPFLFQVVFSVLDPAEPVQIELAVGPYGYSTHAHVGGGH